MLRSDPGVEVVGECSDGPEAVRLAERLRPDVVLMDVEMPGGDGITGTAELRDRVPEAGVLVLTTFDVDEYVLGARAGAAGVLLKPTPPRGLIDAVLECASGGAALGPTVVERLVATYVARPARSPCRDWWTSPRCSARSLAAMAGGLSNAEIGAEL